jgi:hypothetical protein
MYINRKWVAICVIIVSIVVFYFGLPSLMYVFTPEFPIGPKLVQGAIFISIMAAIIWSNWTALNWVERGGVTGEESTTQKAQQRANRRVEQILSNLNDDEYAMLQTRLSQRPHDDEREDDYPSMQSMLDASKRKNQ